MNGKSTQSTRPVWHVSLAATAILALWAGLLPAHDPAEAAPPVEESGPAETSVEEPTPSVLHLAGTWVDRETAVQLVLLQGKDSAEVAGAYGSFPADGRGATYSGTVSGSGALFVSTQGDGSVLKLEHTTDADGTRRLTGTLRYESEEMPLAFTNADAEVRAANRDASPDQH